ncbi:MAG: HEPN domain-containing protein, partial [Candidatus Bathyarchaeia archaeon]
RGFYETSVIQMERGLFDLATFSIEQSLQLYLKAMLLRLGVDYPATHSLRRLLDIIARITEDEMMDGLVKIYAVELAALEDAYITSRYIVREFTREEVERLKEVVDRVMDVVGGVVDRRSSV